MQRYVLSFFALFCIAAIAHSAPTVVNGEYDARSFGAKGDGKAVDTRAINRAIETAATAGGGTVRFPAGTYRSFSIHLKSNVALYLDQGATIEAATPGPDGEYDPAEPGPEPAYQDYGHSHWHNSLIWGENLQNVSILGPGRIWGKGLVRSDSAEKGKGKGDRAIALKLCRNVTIRDVTIEHGGWFGILATGVDNLTIDNVKMDTNRDGMDIDCCRHVRISNCSVNSPFDDGICLKSSYGLGFNRPTEDVTITNCEVSGFDEGTFLDGTYQRKVKYGDRGPTGRIKFGTEANGGFKNITISNCVFEYCRGLALEEVDGGPLEDVTITGLTMRDIQNAPIFIRLGNRARGPAGTPVSTLRRVTISDVVIYNANPRHGCIISGIPNHPIEDLSLNNIRIVFGGGGTKEQAALTPPEDEKGYPEPYRLGDMPAYGMYLRHVKNVSLANIHLSYLKDDARPAFVLEDVLNADFRFVKAQKPTLGTPLFTLRNVNGLTIRDVAGVTDTTKDRVLQGNL